MTFGMCQNAISAEARPWATLGDTSQLCLANK